MATVEIVVILGTWSGWESMEACCGHAGEDWMLESRMGHGWITMDGSPWGHHGWVTKGT